MQGKDNPALTPEEYRAPAITFLIHHVQTYWGQSGHWELLKNW
jgi:hypothetical protein